jgi:hypothetical protein
MDTETPAAAPEVETVTPDAPVEVEPVGTEPTPEPSDSTPTPSEIEMSEKFNQVAAREKDLRDSEDKIKAERETHGATTAELEETRKILATFKDDPLAGLKALGIEFKEVAERVINDGAPTAEHRVAKLEKQWTDQRQADADAREASETAQKAANEKFQAEEQERAVIQTEKDIAGVIEAGGDKYELIKAQGAESLVFDVAAQVYKETKKILTWEEAADQVEKNISDEVEKYLATSKFKAKYQPVPDKKEISEDEQDALDSNFYARELLKDKYSRVLNNQMVSEGAAPQDPAKWLSDEDSKDYLAKKLERMLAT